MPDSMRAATAAGLAVVTGSKRSWRGLRGAGGRARQWVRVPSEEGTRGRPRVCTALTYLQGAVSGHERAQRVNIPFGQPCMFIIVKTQEPRPLVYLF